MSKPQKIEKKLSKDEQLRQKYGEFNDFPENFREITEKYLAQNTLFQSYTPEYVEYRQMCRKGTGAFATCPVHAHLYHFHDGTGVAIAIDCWGHGYYAKPSTYEGKHVRFYAFGCEHKFRGMTEAERNERKVALWNCMSASICEKCGSWNVVDSSD
jgi:hypothetical protein